MRSGQRILGDGQVVQVTCNQAIVADCLQLGFFHATALKDKRTTGVESAPFGRINWTRHVPLENDALPGGSRFWDWHGREQGLRIRVPRSRKDRPFWAHLYDLAEIHDRDAMSHVLDDGEVVT